MAPTSNLSCVQLVCHFQLSWSRLCGILKFQRITFPAFQVLPNDFRWKWRGIWFAFLEHHLCLLLAQVSKSTLCSQKKTKPPKTAAILASHVNKISPIPVRDLTNAKIFLDISMYLTLPYNSVLHLLSSPITRTGDIKPFMIKKCVFCFWTGKKGG